MIVSSLSEIKFPSIFYQCHDFIDNINLYIKLEGLNIAGSIKLKTALYFVNNFEKMDLLKKGKTLICSSSGNLAVALSIICKDKGYPLICVIDPNISVLCEKYLELYGANIIKVSVPDVNSGYLQTRLNLIKQMLEEDSNLIFVDQYDDPININAHYHLTAKEVINEFPRIDYLFIGAGTTGTLMGCAKYFKLYSPNTKIIAVDSKGSVTFQDLPGKRYIPGLGTSKRPSIINPDFIDDIVFVDESDTVAMCRQLLHKKGLLLGGSSGTTIQGVYQYHRNIEPHSQVVAISPDFGDRYLTTVYDDKWVNDKFSIKEDANVV